MCLFVCAGVARVCGAEQSTVQEKMHNAAGHQQDDTASTGVVSISRQCSAVQLTACCSTACRVCCGCAIVLSRQNPASPLPLSQLCGTRVYVCVWLSLQGFLCACGSVSGLGGAGQEWGWVDSGAWLHLVVAGQRLGAIPVGGTCRGW